ncbi:hypothetical protein BH10PSE5_BH10PSE5_24320 [soil metagenome]
MKKTLLTLIAASTLTAAALPAAAAAPYGANNINAHQAQIETRINQGVRSHRLTQREASQLRVQVRQIAQLEARYRVNGLQNWERQDLDRRLDRVGAQVTAQMNDRDHSGGRYAGGYRR